MKRTLILSAGHNPRAKGAQVGDTSEYSLNCRVVMELTDALRKLGVNPVVVDSSMSLTERIAWINSNYPEAICIEFHHNVFNKKAEGTEVFFKAGDKIGFDLGKKMLSLVSAKLSLRNRGMKLASQSARGSLAWVSGLSHGLLWEVCFMDNPEDITRGVGFPETLAQCLSPEFT